MSVLEGSGRSAALPGLFIPEKETLYQVLTGVENLTPTEFRTPVPSCP